MPKARPPYAAEFRQQMVDLVRALGSFAGRGCASRFISARAGNAADADDCAGGLRFIPARARSASRRAEPRGR